MRIGLPVVGSSVSSVIVRLGTPLTPLLCRIHKNEILM